MTTAHKVNNWEVQGFGEIPNIETFVGGRTVSEEFVAFSKGAVDSLLQVCDRVLVNRQVVPLTDDWRQRIVQANEGQASRGLRVLGVAFREWETLPAEQVESSLEKELIFIGMFSMIDPARPEVKDAIQTCKTAGIRVIMITGDHPLTARYIADELGIGAGDEVILTGQDLATKDNSELKLEVERVNVFARVSPEHKLEIVQALQDLGEITAMTGDGVNDAPALNKADIGVSMGITGTDVAKEASDMILLDDNFATIVAAVEEGRRIYDNIRKFIKYTMTSNAGEIWVMLLAPFLGMPFPLEPLQILWINLVTDGLPGLALGVEPAERRIMHRPPYRPNENFFGRGMGRDIVWVGLLMGLVSLGIGYFFQQADLDYMRTMVFTTLTLSQMGNALAIRSQRESLFQIGLLSNRALLGAVALTFVLQIAVIYLPFMQAVFGTASLSLVDLLIALALSTVVFWAIEFSKWLIRRGESA
jgi:Ca2+-transporting ATPase